MDLNDRPATSISGAIAAELKKPGSLALLFMATALSVVSAFNLPEAKVPVIWPVTLCILWATYVWISSAALGGEIGLSTRLQSRVEVLEAEPNLQLPKVIRAMQGAGADGELILLLRPNQLFGQSMLVSIYFEDERGLELLVADGSVRNIQMNGLIQVGVAQWDEVHSDVQRKIVEQDQLTIDRLMVKPASNTTFRPSDIDTALLRLMSQENREAVND